MPDRPVNAGYSRSLADSPTPRITGTHTGDTPELPASGGAIDVECTAFLTLSGGMVTEVRTVFDSLALAVQTGAAEAPAWWPGRS